MKNTVQLFCLALTLAIATGIAPSPGLTQTQESNSQSDYQSASPLKPGDQIHLTVAGFPELSSDQVIMADGTIQMSLVGSLNLAGLAPTQAVTLITNALNPYVRRPQVALSLLSLSPLRVSVTGEVLHPGPRLFNPAIQQNPAVQQNNNLTNGSQSNSPTTVSDTLVAAGGVTPNADLRNIVVRRIVAGNTTATPGDVTRSEIKVDLWNAVQSGNLDADVRIQDGDEIVVPPAQLNDADQQVLLTSTIAPTNITVQVTGEVNRPGQLEIGANARVSEAIAAAGGPTDKADRDSIELFRMSSDGQLEHQTFALNESSLPLRNGDLLVIKKSNSSELLDTFGRILGPVNFLLNLF